MGAPDKVLELVEKFERNLDSYKDGKYNETQLRREFLDPFFKVMGWDVDNEQGYAEAYKDVIHEDAIKIGGTTKAPDYCFRIGGQRKFFVEAKKPSVNIHDDVSPAFQLRRYAWTAKLPLSILTDFEELAVYDCLTKRPNKTDKASTSRIHYYHFRDYADEWDEIYGVFARESILKGSFDKYAASHKKRGTAAVDDEFLKEIESWRDSLARNLAIRNPELTTRDLNYAVQKTIDRIIFLRICEDRGIERPNQLRGLLNGEKVYARMSQMFERADERYNSGLFHFHREQDRAEPPDEFTLTLNIDDKTLKEIIKNLYYPESPYEFSVFSADILGQVYEQFLGKVIRLTSGHQAKIEEKPEVKKAGGVYYTPTYIVDYIVQQTVGKLVEGKTPREIGGLTNTWRRSTAKDARALKILDPACGSGSFLIGAYQFLLDWYRDWYFADGTGNHKERIYESAGGEWKLTTSERKRILLDHIYGVDIDPQAVEVTKLSLLLKVLEGESEQSLDSQMKFFRERALPDLSNNIKCGNSLIGSDFYRGKQLDLFDEEEQMRINAFDWEVEFAEIMSGGGFDAVIGNPPYIFTREIFTTEERDFFSSKYAMSFEKHNSFMLFMEMILSLLRTDSVSAFIVPNSWLTIESAKYLREEYIKHLDTIADLNYQVFERVSMEPCIFVTRHNQQANEVKTFRVVEKEAFPPNESAKTPVSSWTKPNFRIVFSSNSAATTFINQLVVRTSIVGLEFDVRSGLQAYERGKGNPPQSAEDVKNHIYDRDEKEDEDTYRYLQGRDVGRWWLNWSCMWMKYGEWLAQPRELGIFVRPRVLIREITGKLPYAINAAFTAHSYLNNKSVLNVLEPNDDEEKLKILVAALNSRLLSLFYKERAVKSARKIFPKIVIRNLREFPFPKEICNDCSSKIVGMVERRMNLIEQINRANTSHQKTLLQRQIESTDREIDRLVYELYGLTEEEIAIVEEATA